MHTIIEIIEEAKKRNSKVVDITNGTAFFSNTQCVKGCTFSVSERTFFDMNGNTISREATKEMKKNGLPFVMATNQGGVDTRIAFM